MSELEQLSQENPQYATILRLIQEKVATKLEQVETESNDQDSILRSLKEEIDALIQTGTEMKTQLDELEAKRKEQEEAAKNKAAGIKIDVDDTIQAGKNIKAPLSTREPKTGLTGAKTGGADTKDRRPSHTGKSDKAQSMNDVSEDNKGPNATKPEKKPGLNNKQPTKPADKAVDKIGDKAGEKKPAVSNEKPGKKVPTDAKKTDKEHEEEKKDTTNEAKPTIAGRRNSKEKTPEQAAAEELRANLRSLTKKELNETSSLAGPSAQVVKLFDAACLLLGEKTGWKVAQTVIKTDDFIKKLTNLAPESVSDEIYSKIKEIVSDKELQPEVTKSKNQGAIHFSKWLHSFVKVKDLKKGSEGATAVQEGATTVQEGEAGEAKTAPEEEKVAENHAVQSEDKETKGESPDTTHTETASDDKEGKIISKADLTTLKSRKNPPAPVSLVLDATCVALKIAPTKHTGPKKTPVFDHAALLNNAETLNKINSLDVTNVPPEITKELREYTSKKDFTVEKVQSIPAAANLCKWILSIMEHDKNPPAETKDEKKEAKDNKTAENKDKPATTAAGKRPGTAVPKKEEKKEEKKDTKKEEKKEDKDAKKPAATPAATTAKTPKPTHKDDKKAPGKTTDGKKGESHPENPELKAIIDSLGARDVSALKNLANPAAPAVKVAQAVSLIVQGKELQWKDFSKAFVADSATLHKMLNVNINTITKEHIEGAKKIITDNNLDEATLTPIAKGCATLLKWVESVIKQAESKGEVANESEKPVEVQAPAENKVEEHKTEEHHEVPQTETKTEENAHHQEDGKTEVKTEVHANGANGDVQHTEVKAEAEPKAEPETTPATEHHEAAPAEEEKQEENANGDVDHKEVFQDLNNVFGYDISQEAHGDVKVYLKQKINEYEDQIRTLTQHNEGLRSEGVQEQPEKKPYEVKESTKSFIQMVELGWVNELIENKEWDEKIYQILVLLFLVEGTPDVPDVDNKDAVRKYATERLKKEEGDIVGFLMSIEKHQNIETQKKIKIQEYLTDKAAILNPTSFDGVDGLCGVISFLMKEVCEYFGVTPQELVKKTSAKEKIYLFNQEKIEYYNQKQNKLIEVAHKHNIPLDS